MRKFAAIARRLWSDIERGRFADRLPPEPELAERYGVSRMTLRRAIAALVEDGFLLPKPGQGTFVMRRRLAPRATRTIGLLVGSGFQDIGADPYFGAVITGLAAAFAGRGYALTLAGEADELVPSAPRQDAGQSRSPVEAVVAIAFDAEHVGGFAELPAPLVLLECAPIAGRSCVIADNAGGVDAAIAHLAGLGHRRIAHITGRPGALAAGERLAAWREALRGRGLPAPAALAPAGDFGVASGHAAMARLLASAQPPTAVLCANDRMAFGAMRCAEERGLRLPRDLSIVGFDDIEAAQHTTPPLTTVRVSGAELAARTADAVFDDLASEPPAAGRVLRVATDMVLRGSTAPPPVGSR